MPPHPSPCRLAAAVVFATLVGGGASAAAQADPRVPDLLGAHAIVIHDYWNGLSPNGPRDFRFRLEPTGAGHTFAGTGSFSLTVRRGGQWVRPTETMTVTVPDSVMKAFLAALSRAPLATGEYRPVMDHTDDYPRLTLTFELPDGVVEFYSSSQGRDMRPWRVNVRGTRYVSDSGAVKQAYDRFREFLRRDELERRILRGPAG